MKIEELTPRQFQRAYEKWVQDEPFHDWWDGVYSQKKEEGKVQGFDIDKIYFSGFCSQGDGASWNGGVDAMERMELTPDVFDLHEHNVMRQATLSDMFAYKAPCFNITTRGNYSHSGTMQQGEIELTGYISEAEIEDGMFAGMRYEDFYELLYPVIDSVAATCFKQAQAFADGIYRALEKEYEYLTSQEQFKEQAEGNDWEFDEEGEIV